MQHQEESIVLLRARNSLIVSCNRDGWTTILNVIQRRSECSLINNLCLNGNRELCSVVYGLVSNAYHGHALSAQTPTLGQQFFEAMVDACIRP